LAGDGVGEGVGGPGVAFAVIRHVEENADLTRGVGIAPAGDDLRSVDVQEIGDAQAVTLIERSVEDDGLTPIPRESTPVLPAINNDVIAVHRFDRGDDGVASDPAPRWAVLPNPHLA